jgi:hypothetical protein
MLISLVRISGDRRCLSPRFYTLYESTVINMCTYMTTLAKLDFHICDGSVRVTTLYLSCQISDGSMIAPRIDRDVAVHRHNTLYVGLLITVIRDGVETARLLPR